MRKRRQKASGDVRSLGFPPIPLLGSLIRGTKLLNILPLGPPSLTGTVSENEPGSSHIDSAVRFPYSGYGNSPWTRPRTCAYRAYARGSATGYRFPSGPPTGEMIRRAHDFPDFRMFRRRCVDVHVLRLDGMLPIEERLKRVGEFAELTRNRSIPSRDMAWLPESTLSAA